LRIKSGRSLRDDSNGIQLAVANAASFEVKKVRESVVMMEFPSGFFGILFGISYRKIPDEANSTIIASTIFSALTLAVTIWWIAAYSG
jgi:malonate transporter